MALNNKERDPLSGIPLSEVEAIAWIINAVSEAFDCHPDQILGRRRQKLVAEARQTVMYLARTSEYISYPHIGKVLDRDHSTVLHGSNLVEKRLDRFDSFLTARVGKSKRLLEL